MNPMLILAPIGTLLVGLLSMIAWKCKGNVGVKYFAIGGLTWVAAIVPKALMDLTITPAINSWAEASLSLTGLLLVSGAYVGLRTGVFECGFTYLILSREV